MKKPRPHGSLNSDAVGARADFVVVERGCKGEVTPDPALFRRTSHRGKVELYVRQEPLPAAVE